MVEILKTVKKEKMPGILKEDMDMEVRLHDDFYHHACGRWLKNNPIPSTETKWGSFYILRDENRNQIKAIFEELEKEDSLEMGSTGQFIRDMYASGMDEDYIESLGITPIEPEFEMIENKPFQETLSHFHKIGVGMLWNSFVSLDDKDSSKMSLHVNQSSLGLPEREYYLSDAPKFVEIREKYILHIRKMLEFTGVSEDESKKAARAIMDIETKLAKVSMPKEERRDPDKTYNKMTLVELQNLTPEVDWKKYFEDMDISDPQYIVVGQVEYMRELNTIIEKTSSRDWKYFMQYDLISDTASLLTKEIVEENFNFYGRIIGGLKEMKPRWQRVYGALNSSLNDALSEEYARRYFSKNAEGLMNGMIQDLLDTYKERIEGLDWLSPETKKKALQKLSTFVSKIGHPKKDHDYKGLVITPNDYVRNSFNAEMFENEKQFAKLNKPVDRDEWLMGAHEVNAYYWSNQNEIVFPAGILQSPFFDEEGDMAMNYGAIGAVIGHELTHGFDDEGSKFDHNGNLNDWWTAEDREAFDEKTKIIEEQYNEFVAIDELFVNGKLTLGENIADLGGVVLGYYALQKYMERNGRLPDINGYTPEQRYFFGTVLVERGLTRDETARMLAVSDPHSPSYTRVNGPLVHFDKFYEAFNIQPNDGMYRKASERAEIW